MRMSIMQGLWFDVEKRYKTIRTAVRRSVQQLWFDVEKRYKTMAGGGTATRGS